VSNRLLSVAWKLSLPATEKVVLAALADCADDAGITWIAIRSLRDKMDLITMTSLSERAIQIAIKALVAGGHLSRVENPGRGVLYTVHPRTTCAPAQDAPPQEVRPAGGAPTPAPRAPKPPVTPIPPKAAPSKVAREDRASRLADDWSPKPLTGVSAVIVDRWEPGRLERALDGFRNHHAGKGSRMVDWDAAWRTWVGNEEKFTSRDRRNAQRNYHDRPSGWAPRAGHAGLEPASLDD
jgi:hypothetical protein